MLQVKGQVRNLKIVRIKDRQTDRHVNVDFCRLQIQIHIQRRQTCHINNVYWARCLSLCVVSVMQQQQETDVWHTRVQTSVIYNHAHTRTTSSSELRQSVTTKPKTGNHKLSVICNISSKYRWIFNDYLRSASKIWVWAVDNGTSVVRIAGKMQ